MTEPLRLRRILVPTDFSATAGRAVEVAAALASGAGPAEVVLVHANFMPRELEALAVFGPEKVFEALEKSAVERLDQLVSELWGKGVSARHIHRDGRPDEVIVALAQAEDADLIVIGTHGRRGLSHLFLGSVAERVLRLSPCPVVAVPPPEE